MGVNVSFSWHDTCQEKRTRAINTIFDLSMLFDEIFLVEIDSYDYDISSISTVDSLSICSRLREKTK